MSICNFILFGNYQVSHVEPIISCFPQSDLLAKRNKKKLISYLEILCVPNAGQLSKEIRSFVPRKIFLLDRLGLFYTRTVPKKPFIEYYFIWNLGGDGTYHFKLLVPSVAAGAIIGKGGETIAQLQKETGARVKMSKAHDFYPG